MHACVCACVRVCACVCLANGQESFSEEMALVEGYSLAGCIVSCGWGVPQLGSEMLAAVSASHCSAPSCFRPPLPSPAETAEPFQRKPLLILAASLDTPTHSCSCPGALRGRSQTFLSFFLSFFFFVVLGFGLRAYTLSQSTSPFCDRLFSDRVLQTI
jgi:hypothetical protein